MTTATYTDYPFSVNGVKFISRIYTHSDMAKTIANLPAGVFSQMNQDAVADIIGNPSLLSNAELVEELERVNDGGTHAFILLDA
jgi:CBS-domain-containing membrane protein